MMTRLKFREWMRRARPNERLVYYRGFLLKDRGSDDRTQRTDDQHAIAALGDAAYEAYRQGVVVLFQRRTGPMTFDYYAIRL